MNTKKEIEDFNKKLKMLREIFPHDIPKDVYYIIPREHPSEDMIVTDWKGEEVNLNVYREILVVGDEIVNVGSNSVELNLNIVLAIANSNQYRGRIATVLRKEKLCKQNQNAGI